MTRPTFTNILPVFDNYDGVTTNTVGTGAISLTVSPAPQQSSGIIELNYPTNPSKNEMMKFTANSSGTLTIPANGRGLGGTTEQAHSAAGVKVIMPYSEEIHKTIDDAIASKANKTNPVLDGNISGTAILDDDSMAGATSTKVPTAESVKAYVDGQMITAGAGNVVGTTSSVDNSILRFDGVTGKVIQGSSLSLSDDSTIYNPTTKGGVFDSKILVSTTVGETSIYNALNTISNGVVYVKNGTYTLSNSPLLDSNVTIIGESVGGVVINTSSYMTINLGSYENITFKNIKFDGDFNFMITAPKNVVFENCYFTSSMTNGIMRLIGSSGDVSFRNCIIKTRMCNPTYTGKITKLLIDDCDIELNIGSYFLFTNTTSQAADSIFVSNSYIYGNHPLKINSGTISNNSFFESSVIGSNTAGGIVANASIIGNSFRIGASTTIQTAISSCSNVVGNNIDGYQAGIFMSLGETISNNSINNCTYYGINAGTSQNNTVSSNYIYNCSTGINLTSMSNYNIVTSNLTKSCTAGLSNLGTGNVVANNLNV